MKRTVVSVVLLVALVALVAMAIGGAGATTQADDSSKTNGSFGAEISSFMQASSAEAEGEVDDGMFGAALNRTNDPDERRTIIEQRRQQLEERQARLQDRRSRISTDDGPTVRDRALATHVEVGASNLEASANGTARASQAAGLDTDALDQIRRNARDLRGPAVAELARNLIGTRSASERGPPAFADGGNRSTTDAPWGNRTGAEGPPGDDDSDPGTDPADSDGVGAPPDGSGSTGDGSEGNEGNSDQSGDPGPPDDSDDQPGNADSAGQSNGGS